MKATLILATLILFAALMGCSDSVNLNDPLKSDNQFVSQSTKNPGSGDIGSTELIWKCDQLIVKPDADGIVENRAAYVLPPFSDIAKYMVTFDGYTNADKFTYGLAPLAQVSKDEEVVFEARDSWTINGSHEIRLDNVRFDAMKFYIALFQIDASGRPNKDKDPSTVCTLKLTNIKIYRIN